jgi:hypothetical protein
LVLGFHGCDKTTGEAILAGNTILNLLEGCQENLITSVPDSSNSTGVQIGDHNIQHIANSLVGLVDSIDAATGPKEQKTAAKGLLREFITNPVVASVLGSAAGGIMTVLSK